MNETHMAEEYFQTRSEKNGIHQYHILQDAYDSWMKDPSIWKISFQNNRWMPEEFDGQIWWSNKPIEIDMEKGAVNDNVVEMLTDEEFRQKYNLQIN